MATNDFWNSEVVCNLCLFPYTWSADVSLRKWWLYY